MRTGASVGGRVTRRGPGARVAMVGGVCAVVAVGLSGCIAPSGFETVGRTGVMSVEGDLAVVWDSCGEEAVASVVMHADREGLADDEENPLVGSWQMGDRSRQDKLFVPSAADDPPQLDPARGYIVQAIPAGEIENLPGVHFTLDQVAQLGPQDVLLGAEDGSIVGTWEDLTDC